MSETKRGKMSVTSRMAAWVILGSVADSYGVTVGDLLGRNRQPEIVTARHTAMVIIRDQLRLTHESVGKFFGMHHGTVIWACKNVRNWLDVDESFRVKFAAVVAAAVSARHTAQKEIEGEAA